MPRIIVVSQPKRDLGRPSTPPSDAAPSDDSPPVCPVCTRRLVIIGMRAGRDETGVRIRRQLWGCPFGHATTLRTAGAFGPFDILADPAMDEPDRGLMA